MEKRDEFSENKENLNQIKQIWTLLEEYETILFHKNLAKSQREVYKRHQTVDELKNSIMIELDFKQRIKIGMGPRQVASQYFNQKEILCLGFGVYFVDENNETSCVNFDLVSADLTENSDTTVCGFRFLREHQVFNEIEAKFHGRTLNFNVWADCGKHFKNQLVLGYLFNELKEENIQVNLNYFADHHGKNARDAHFSQVSKFVKDMSLHKPLENTQDVVDAINLGQKKANENSKKPIRTISFEFEEEKRKSFSALSSKIKPIVVTNLVCFYNFRNRRPNFEFVSSVLSNGSELETVEVEKLVSEMEKNQNQNKFMFYDGEATSKPGDIKRKLITLKQKENRMITMIEKIRNFAIETENFDSNSQLFRFIGTNNTFSDENEVKKSFAKTNDDDDDNDDPNRTLRFPKYCKQDTNPCGDCKAECSLKMINLVTKNKRLKAGQVEILNELKLHSHPQNRKMPTKRQRNRNQAAEELACHYEYFHNKKRPRLD